MKNTLLGRGILLPTGEISKDKINLVAGAVTEPFAEMVWATTGGDWETINRLTDILVTMNTAADCGKLFKIVQMLYGLLGLRFSEEAAAMGLHPEDNAIFPVLVRRRLWRNHAGVQERGKVNRHRKSGVRYFP